MNAHDPAPPLLRATRDGGLKGRVDTALAWALAVLMGLSVLNVLWQVTTRFVLGSPSGFTDELARYLLIWVGLLGAAYAAGQKMHLAIDLLPRALRQRDGRGQHVIGVVIEGAVLAFALVAMVYGGANLVRLTTTLEQVSAALGAPLGAVYSVLPISGGLIAFYAALALADHVRALRGHAPRLSETDATTAEEFAAHEVEAATPPPSKRS